MAWREGGVIRGGPAAVRAVDDTAGRRCHVEEASRLLECQKVRCARLIRCCTGVLDFAVRFQYPIPQPAGSNVMMNIPVLTVQGNCLAETH